MFTIIGGDGKEYGPVPESQVRAWMAAGRADLHTKAKRLGEEDWRSLGEFSEFGGGMSTPPSLPIEPAAPAAPMDARALADDLLARAGKLDLGRCLNRGWDLWMQHLGRLALMNLVFFLISLAVACVPAGGLIFGGVLTAGWFHYTLKLLHGEKAALGDLFVGFRENFGPLILAGIAVALLTVLGFVFLILPGIYLAVAWTFTYPLILEKNLSFGEAMQVSRRVISHNWWKMFLLIIVACLLSLLGLAALVIGVFLTMPITICMLACAYDSLCNPPEKT
ncbi:MAG: DUF4339 domain-containing protein [Verrucomicrobiota bacterium]|nr:DUF4339 domain-containing protein [Verrucomicrobiota bacterium]